MTTFDLTAEWCTAGDDMPALEQTMAMLRLQVGDTNLTQHVDIWENTVRERVLVSAYPLAMWFARSWWRLLTEPLPADGHAPSLGWRLAHELGAANEGFVWPHILFAPRQGIMQIWARPSPGGTQQSVKYINGLGHPASIALAVFEQTVVRFIDDVIDRLDAGGLPDTPLKHLWAEVGGERSDPEASAYRRAEALFGFDPDGDSAELVESPIIPAGAQ